LITKTPDEDINRDTTTRKGVKKRIKGP